MPKCFKCGKPKFSEWRICSDGPWRPICKEHDIELNTIAARWAYGDTPEADQMIADYTARVNHA